MGGDDPTETIPQEASGGERGHTTQPGTAKSSASIVFFFVIFILVVVIFVVLAALEISVKQIVKWCANTTVPTAAEYDTPDFAPARCWNLIPALRLLPPPR